MEVKSAQEKPVSQFVENISESTVACLITMVQGNVLALGLSHWVIASQTGIIAGSIAAMALLLTHTRNRWFIATMLGVTTAVVDFFVHPGMFGPVFAEALVTGIGAAVLSYIVGWLWTRFTKKEVGNSSGDEPERLETDAENKTASENFSSQ